MTSVKLEPGRHVQWVHEGSVKQGMVVFIIPARITTWISSLYPGLLVKADDGFYLVSEGATVDIGLCSDRKGEEE